MGSSVLGFYKGGYMKTKKISVNLSDKILSRLTSLEQRMEKASEWFGGLEERVEKSEDAITSLLDDAFLDKPDTIEKMELTKKKSLREKINDFLLYLDTDEEDI
jgi:hypothetical protein